MTSDNSGIVVSIADDVLSVVLDRPSRMNAVTTASLDAIAAAFESASDDSMVRAAVITGTGSAFCTGADIIGIDTSAAPSAVMIDSAERAVRAILSFPKPVIAAVNGPAAGVGVSLALACDLTVAVESAYFVLAFTKVGLMPDGAATALVAAAIGRANALKLALLAGRVSASEALSAGLIADTFKADEFTASVGALASSLAAGPSDAYRLTKAAINEATLVEVDEAFRRERSGQLELLGSSDYREGVAAFRDKRAASFGTDLLPTAVTR